MRTPRPTSEARSVPAPVVPRLRLLELYCGIGGCAAAVAGAARVVAAVDINTDALRVYRANQPHRVAARTLETVGSDELARFEADLWWLSPPCQPFTRRGRQRDDDDPRTASLLALATRIAEVRPRYLALENVPGFGTSRTRRALITTLDAHGYSWVEAAVCPSELGLPNRRRRYYLVASRDGTPEPFPPRAGAPRPLAGFVDAHDDPELAVDRRTADRYRHAIDVVDRDDPAAVTAYFTSAYGRSPVRSGSYLRTASGLRRFSPAEVLRLLGFPASYRLPSDLSREAAWRLAGNSLSLPAVRWALAAVPGLAATLPGGPSHRPS